MLSTKTMNGDTLPRYFCSVVFIMLFRCCWNSEPGGGVKKFGGKENDVRRGGKEIEILGVNKFGGGG